jgi:hypothetical protein
MKLPNAQVFSIKTRLLATVGLVFVLVALIGAVAWHNLSTVRNFVEDSHSRVAGVLAERKGEAAAAQARDHQQSVEEMRAAQRRAQWLTGGLLGGAGILILVLGVTIHFDATRRERAEQERERADQERAQAEQERAAAAEQERERAEQERERAEQGRARAEQERERAEEASQQLAELYGAFSNAVETVLMAKSPEELHHSLCDASLNLKHFTGVSIFVAEPDGSARSSPACRTTSSTMNA